MKITKPNGLDLPLNNIERQKNVVSDLHNKDLMTPLPML